VTLGLKKKFWLAAAIISLMAISSASAFADALSGGLFVSSNGNNKNFLVLTLSDGSTRTLDTLHSPINPCAGAGCTSGFSANQGWWSITDRLQTNDNPNYRAGISTLGDTYRDFFTFDLSQAGPIAGGVSVVGAVLEVLRYSSDPAPGGVIGLNLGVVGGSDAAGLPVTAARLNDKADDGDASNMFNAIGNATLTTAFKVPTSGDPNDLLAFDLASIIGAIHLGATGTDYFSIGGSTFDIAGYTGPLKDPTIVPPAAVPEPASLLLLASGFSGAWVRRRRK